MNKFKVGDWIRRKSDQYHKIDKIDETMRLLFSTEKFTDSVAEDCELWEPKEGEWCWFWNICCHPKLLKFKEKVNESQIIGDVYYFAYDINGQTNTFRYCEPFCGELPSTISEKENE